MDQIQKGIYEHYKGNRYQVLDLARHTETEELLVIYKALYEGDFPKETLWARPISMFQEHVAVNGKKIPRFRYISP
jgi:hypothetical protein